MLITFDGVSAEHGDYESFARVYGSCGNVTQYAQKALDFFESFGINTTAARQDPFKFMNFGDYDFSARFIVHPTSRALMGTFYEYGEYLDAPVYRTFWRYRIYADLNGPRGPLKTGTELYYGVLR